MDRLRVGIALFNAERYLAAHEPLEERWLDDPAGEREACLQGLIQASAAVYKSRRGNDDGAVGLAEGALAYLTDCSVVEGGPLRVWLGEVAADPAVGRKTDPPELRLEGAAVGVRDLTPAEVAAAAEAVAEADDDELIATAAGYAKRDVAEGDATSPFVALAREWVCDRPPVVRQRLREHVERRSMRELDVEGLFE